MTATGNRLQPCMNCRWSNGHEFFLFALQLFKFPLTHKPAVDWPVALIHRVTSTSCGCRETDPQGSADFLRTACKPPRPLGLAGTHQRLNTETRNDAKERNKYKRANRELGAEAAPPPLLPEVFKVPTLVLHRPPINECWSLVSMGCSPAVESATEDIFNSSHQQCSSAWACSIDGKLDSFHWLQFRFLRLCCWVAVSHPKIVEIHKRTREGKDGAELKQETTAVLFLQGRHSH